MGWKWDKNDTFIPFWSQKIPFHLIKPLCLWLNPFFVWDLWIEPSKSSIFSSSNKVKTFRQTQKKLKTFENFIKRWEKISNFFAKIFTWPSTTYCCQTVSVLLFKRFIVHRTWRKSFKNFSSVTWLLLSQFFSCSYTTLKIEIVRFCNLLKNNYTWKTLYFWSSRPLRFCSTKKFRNCLKFCKIK